MRGLILLVVGLIILGPARAQTGPAPNPGIGTAFMDACYKGDLAKVTQLLDQGAPLEVRDSYGRTPLFLACHGNESEIVKLLLAHGAKADVASSNGDTTIGRACEYGDLASAQMVLAAGADPAKANQYGHTPLMLAAREGHDSLVAFLIEQHVDVNVEGKGESALSEAVWKDHPSIVTMLFNAGAKVPVFAITPDSLTIVGWAAVTKDIPLVDILLAHGADINGAGDHGITPLLVAIDQSTPEMVVHLLDKGADPQKRDDKKPPIFCATYCHQLTEMQALLDHHANINDKDSEGSTSLIWACSHDSEAEVTFLVNHGADLSLPDAKGETPLRYVHNRGDTAMAQLLVAKGAHPEDPFIIDGERPSPPLTPVQNWALSVGAIYKQINGENHYFLGGKTSKNSSIEELKSDWNVTDQKSLLAELDELRDRGHHTKFQTAGAALATLSDMEFTAKVASLAPDDAHQATALRNSYLKWKDRSGLAWDMCRSVAMINNGYNAGYIDDQETWNRLFAIAEVAQKNFSSWQELSDNFLDGREIWANTRSSQFEACAQLLLNPKDPNSPWNQNPWKTPLSGSPTTDSTPAQ